ncbi:MAG: hypothetical protein GF392_05900 [Candidatus Omnitrophica bacterium]|nr:hypothetical protein [Candidatus Omnitrophota bacterium]
MRKLIEYPGIRAFFCAFTALFVVSSADPALARTKWERSRGGLGTLMELARDRGGMQEEYEQETESFEDISKAVRNDILKKGYRSFEVSKKFGEPVIRMTDAVSGNEVWLYKPADGWFIDNVPRVSLEFDADGALVSAEYVPREPEKEQRDKDAGKAGDDQVQ